MASFRVHFLVEDKNGPIVSGPMPGDLAFVKPAATRLRAACDTERKIVMSDFHLGTGEPAAVICEDCAATPEFIEAAKTAWRPGQQTQATVAHASKPAGCCD